MFPQRKIIGSLQGLRENQIIHATKRAKERFNLDINIDDLNFLIQKIKDGKSILTFRKSQLESNHVIFFKDYYLIAGFNLATDMITTLIPIEGENSSKYINLIIKKNAKILINKFFVFEDNEHKEEIRDLFTSFRETIGFKGKKRAVVDYLQANGSETISKKTTELIKRTEELKIFLSKSFKVNENSLYDIVVSVINQQYNTPKEEKVLQILEEAKKFGINKMDFSNISLK